MMFAALVEAGESRPYPSLYKLDIARLAAARVPGRRVHEVDLGDGWEVRGDRVVHRDGGEIRRGTQRPGQWWVCPEGRVVWAELTGSEWEARWAARNYFIGREA